MSDFLIHTGKKYSSTQLLALLRQPYGGVLRKGRCWDFSWGSLAVLEESPSRTDNIVATDRQVFAWVGDLAGDISDAFLHALVARLTELQKPGLEKSPPPAGDELFRSLNGAFAMVLANETGVSIVTDPLGFTQVFRAESRDEQAVSLGTHADLVAVLAGTSDTVDLVSIAEMLLNGYSSFPATMYRDVEELEPGSVYCLNPTDGAGCRPVRRTYWSPPPEMRDGNETPMLARLLRDGLTSAVRDRCRRGTVAVALSGGLDSRLVMAAVPQEQECIGLTLCDRVNREARTARKVAAAYHRAWFPLFRGADYLADHLVDIVRLIGFECEFVHAHLFGFADVIAEKADTLFTGDLFDTLLRAYTAKDFVLCRRWGGLLPGRYEKDTLDYAGTPSDSHPVAFGDGVIEGVVTRGRKRHEANAKENRGSLAEWLKTYPFRHWLEVATWAAQRRVLPLRLVGADRRLLDFAFRCPIELKLGNRILFAAAREIYGKGLRVPCANNGVRPCSEHWSRLFQRAVRKSRDGGVQVLERLGRAPVVQHSWHDYQGYWRESSTLGRLIDEYRGSLAEFGGTLFAGDPTELLAHGDLPWRSGLRLLQLAIWRSLVRQYRLEGNRAEGVRP